MKKLIKILAILIIYIEFITPSFAQEKSDVFPIIAVSNEAKVKLKTMRTIAILLRGNNSLLTRIIEDALAIYLTNEGFTIINRELLEKSIGKLVAKKKKERSEGAINALDIGIAVNADSILTGTIVIEFGEQSSLLIKVASFQLLDVASGKVLINVLFESEKGKSFSEIAKRFVKILEGLYAR